jgi:RNA polymerase subunit RPABC4/transcription elongation factor Spt4
VLHELQITANSCQTCRRPIDDDFNVCPHCRTVLREPCRSCSRLVRTSWITCPYCGVDRVRPQAVQQHREPAPAYAYPEGTDSSAAPLQPPARRTQVPAGQRDLLQTARQPSTNGGQNGLPNRPAPRGEN